MILSDGTIKEMLKSGQLGITPLEEEQIQPASVDLRLGTNFLRVDENSLTSMSLDEEAKYIEIVADEIIIPPHSFLLATTKEYIKIPNNITAFVEGRSSIGRLGLFIHNAGLIDAGFEGEITLELYNANRVPLKLKADRRICQIVFHFMDKEAQNPYRGKYQGQKQATGSRIYNDYENQ